MATKNPEIIAKLEDQAGFLMAVGDEETMVFKSQDNGGISNTAARGCTREKLSQGGPRS